MNVVATQNVASIEANANPTGEAAADIGLTGFDDVLQQARRSKQPPAQAATQERKSREEARDNGDVEARATVGGPAIAIAGVAPMPPPAGAAAPFAQAPLAGAAQAGLRRASPDKSPAAAIMERISAARAAPTAPIADGPALDVFNVSTSRHFAPVTDAKAAPPLPQAKPALEPAGKAAAGGEATQAGEAAAMEAVAMEPAQGGPATQIAAVVTRAARAAPVAEAVATPAAAPQARDAAPAQVLKLELAPAGLGAVTVTLRLNAGALDLRLSLSSAQGAAVVERERDLLIQRLQDSGYAVDGLTIERAAPVAQAQAGDKPQLGAQRDGMAQAGQEQQPRHDHSRRRKDAQDREAARPHAERGDGVYL